MKPKKYTITRGDEVFVESCPFGATLQMFKRSMAIKYGIVKVKEIK